MTRCQDWPARLAAEIERARHARFRWGEHDCALFAADVVRALTGFDLAAEFRGTYRSSLGARQWLRKYCGLLVLATRKLGDPIPVAVAARGDIVARCDERGPALGVCLGARCAFTGPRGLMFLPLAECVQAWRV